MPTPELTERQRRNRVVLLRNTSNEMMSNGVVCSGVMGQCIVWLATRPAECTGPDAATLLTPSVPEVSLNIQSEVMGMFS